jgi:hypothetical protein
MLRWFFNATAGCGGSHSLLRHPTDWSTDTRLRFNLQDAITEKAARCIKNVKTAGPLKR